MQLVVTFVCIYSIVVILGTLPRAKNDLYESALYIESRKGYKTQTFLMFFVFLRSRWNRQREEEEEVEKEMMISSSFYRYRHTATHPHLEKINTKMLEL